MQNVSDKEKDGEVLKSISYLVGNGDVITDMQAIPAREPFSDEVLDFLNSVSKQLVKSEEARKYPDVVSFGFWIRMASTSQLKEKYTKQDENIHLGRGIAFHIAPSNVPVNYAYSLAVGLLTGNANIVRIPSKDFPQVEFINEAIKNALEEHVNMKPYIVLIRYGRERKINDLLSMICNVRIIWGGDATISEIRKSPLPPRAGEVTFADRYSLAVIDSNTYLETEDKGRIAEAFYNDTFLTDQNACTSPRIVVWMGSKKNAAKEIFWEKLHELARKKYTFQPIQGVNKLTSSYLAAVAYEGTLIEEHTDNLIIRVNVPEVSAELMELKDNSGYFYEYDCDEIMEIHGLCNDNRCQTMGFLGKKEQIMPLLTSGIKGIDRVVPVGKTMDFELVWDGYHLVERLTRIVKVNI